ncbi:MAG: undecaprenyl-diphosphate phosphatase [Opitutales bacterium]
MSCIACVILLLPLRAAAAEQDGGVEARSLGYSDALVLGGVEGFTEYLPVSSTGHLILTNRVLGLDDGADATTQKSPLSAAVDAYSIVIQAGAIAAVVILYWRDLWLVFLGLTGRSREGFRLGLNLLFAFLPAAVLGLLLNDWIEARLFGPVPVAAALLMGAPLMLGVEAWRKRRNLSRPVGEIEKELHQITLAQALFIGLLQSVAMWPGTSRSMMTITGGYMVGLSPAKSAKFSFLLGLVTLSAATAYTLLKHGREMAASLDAGPVLVGLLVATLTAALSVKWLVSYLSRKGLALFAWYRVALAIAVFALV